MKDDETFPDLKIGLEKIDLGNGRSSLVAGAPPRLLDRTLKLRPSSAQEQQCDRILQILTDKFSQSGASHGEIKRAYCEETKMSESAFDRAWRVLVETGRVRKDGKGRGARYFPVGVSVNSVSGRCHDTCGNQGKYIMNCAQFRHGPRPKTRASYFEGGFVGG